MSDLDRPYPLNRRQPVWRILEMRRQDLAWLAEQVEVTPGHLRAVKAGIQPLSSSVRRKAAKALQIPADLLFPDFENLSEAPADASPEPAATGTEG